MTAAKRLEAIGLNDATVAALLKELEENAMTEVLAVDRSTITHELGVKLESRYGEAWEHKNMAMVLRDLPMIAEEITSIWCDSNACADYTVYLRQPVSMGRAKEIGRQLSKAFLRIVGGYNGIWVWAGDVLCWEDSGNWQEHWL